MIKLLGVLTLSLLNTSVMAGDWISTITASSPLNWYRLDETTGTVAIDYGSQGLNGMYGSGVNGPARGAIGPVGGAVEFDGTAKNILLGGSALTGDWTAEFILKKTGTKFSAELIRGAPLEYPSSHIKLEQYPDTGQVGITESFAADQVFSPAVVAPIGQFIHLTIAKSGLGTSAFVDGAFAGYTLSVVDLYRYQFGDTGTESPIAIVDEIVVYNRALSPQEIAEHYYSIPEQATFATFVAGILCGTLRRQLGVRWSLRI